MKSFFSAYQAYERRVYRGEFTHLTNKTKKRFDWCDSLLSQLGETLIQIGMKLKQQHSTRKTIAWSPLVGSKP